MPKKTKREKILASYRRQLEVLKKNTDNPSLKTLSSTSNAVQEKIVVTTKPIDKTINNEMSVIRKFFLIDLKKSLLIIGLIIILEIGLYLTKIIK